MQNNDYSVKLDIFEGPMDLLTYLVRKNDIDIYNIPIAFITNEYLIYLDFMQSMNIDYAADFLYMAATLAHIKSRMLLPGYENAEDNEEDPRLEIARPLLEYLRLKLASEALAKSDILGRDTFIRQLPANNTQDKNKNDMIDIGLFDLFAAFKQITMNNYAEHIVDSRTDTLSVKDRINEIILILEQETSKVFTDLFDNADKNFVIITFLAILEMAKLNLIEIKQHIQNGIIRVFYL